MVKKWRLSTRIAAVVVLGLTLTSCSDGAGPSSVELAELYQSQNDASREEISGLLHGWVEELGVMRSEAKDKVAEVDSQLEGRVFAAEQLEGFLESTESNYSLLSGSVNGSIPSMMSTLGEVMSQYRQLISRLDAVDNSFIPAPGTEVEASQVEEKDPVREAQKRDRLKTEEQLRQDIERRQQEQEQREAMERELRERLERIEREASDPSPDPTPSSSAPSSEDPGVDNQGDFVPQLTVTSQCQPENCETSTQVSSIADTNGIYVPAGAFNTSLLRAGVVIDVFRGDEVSSFNVRTMNRAENLSDVEDFANSVIIDDGSDYVVLTGGSR